MTPLTPQNVFLFSLRFDCGSGLVRVRSENRVVIGEWNSVLVRQVKRSGTVRLNDGPVARNSAKVSLQWFCLFSRNRSTEEMNDLCLKLWAGRERETNRQKNRDTETQRET